MAWGIRNSEHFDNHEQIAIFVPCRDGGSEILNPCGIKSRQLVLSCSCSLILGIRNSEYFYSHGQIAVFVPCHDGGSESLNPCGMQMGRGIRNSEYFDNHEQIAMFVPCRDGGSEILNHCGIKIRQLVLSCSRSLILGIRNSKYVEQITFFVPCQIA